MRPGSNLHYRTEPTVSIREMDCPHLGQIECLHTRHNGCERGLQNVQKHEGSDTYDE